MWLKIVENCGKSYPQLYYKKKNYFKLIQETLITQV